MKLQFADYEYDIQVFDQPEAFPHVRAFRCPECDRLTDLNACIGFTESPKLGFMAVYECRQCFARYRSHINSTARYYRDDFLADLGLEIWARNDSFNNMPNAWLAVAPEGGRKQSVRRSSPQP